MNKINPLIIAIAASLLLSGCSSLNLVSLGASGLSYLVTGKSVSDHAISTVLDQDCALHRISQGKQTCIEHDLQGIIRKAKPGAPIMIANEDHWQAPNGEVSQLPLIDEELVDEHEPAELSVSKIESLWQNQGLFTIPVTSPATSLESQQATSPVIMNNINNRPALYAVVGSYQQWQNAQINLEKQQQDSTVTAQIINHTMQQFPDIINRYRIVIGPLQPEQFDPQLGNVERRDGHQAWRLVLCQHTLLPPPCH